LFLAGLALLVVSYIHFKKDMDDQLSGTIISAAFRVYNKLGAGFLEKVYENALFIELTKDSITVKRLVPLQVFYEGQEVGLYYADMIIENHLIIELKAIKSILPEHETQLVNYLSATGIDIGLLLNFGEKSVQVKRKYRVYKPKSC
jgi:GxxExxY protein